MALHLQIERRRDAPRGRACDRESGCRAVRRSGRCRRASSVTLDLRLAPSSAELGDARALRGAQRLQRLDRRAGVLDHARREPEAVGTRRIRGAIAHEHAPGDHAVDQRRARGRRRRSARSWRRSSSSGARRVRTRHRPAPSTRAACARYHVRNVRVGNGRAQRRDGDDVEVEQRHGAPDRRRGSPARRSSRRPACRPGRTPSRTCGRPARWGSAAASAGSSRP